MSVIRKLRFPSDRWLYLGGAIVLFAVVPSRFNDDPKPIEHIEQHVDRGEQLQFEQRQRELDAACMTLYDSYEICYPIMVTP